MKKINGSLATLFLSAIMIGVAFTTNIQHANASPPCGSTVSGAVVLDADMGCTNGPGLIVGADGTTINLNGFMIVCTGAGYLGSCEGVPGAIGISTAGFNNVTITGPGTISGFTTGVLVTGGANINVRGLVIVGPTSPGVGLNPRPSSQGILVEETGCPTPPNTIVNIGRNDVSGFTEGIVLDHANCVNVNRNTVHDNNSDPTECHGIVLESSSNNNIGHNFVTHNGENLPTDGGITLIDSPSNTVQSNSVIDNFGDGISNRFAGSTGNSVSNNNANSAVKTVGFFDLAERFGATGNTYTTNCYGDTNIVPAPAMAKVCPRPGAGP